MSMIVCCCISLLTTMIVCCRISLFTTMIVFFFLAFQRTFTAPALCKIAREANQIVPDWLTKFEKGKGSKQWKVAKATLVTAWTLIRHTDVNLFWGDHDVAEGKKHLGLFWNHFCPLFSFVKCQCPLFSFPDHFMYLSCDFVEGAHMWWTNIPLLLHS